MGEALGVGCIYDLHYCRVGKRFFVYPPFADKNGGQKNVAHPT